MKTSANTTHGKVFILDFGSQYTQVIARRIRECQVYSEIVQFNIPAGEVAALKPKGLVLSGGPASVYDKNAPHPDPEIFSLGVPVLGICYGMQLMAHHLGGQVEFSAHREYGPGMLQIASGSQLFSGLGEQIDIWSSHGDKLTALPAGFHPSAHTENSQFAAIEDPSENCTASNSILKWLTRHAERKSSRILSITSAVVRWIGRWVPSSRKRATAFGNK